MIVCVAAKLVLYQFSADRLMLGLAVRASKSELEPPPGELRCDYLEPRLTNRGDVAASVHRFLSRGLLRLCVSRTL
jgi:hypothetical protein